MNRPTTYSFIFILSLSILSTACGKSSNPMRSTQPAQRAGRLPAGKTLAETSENRAGSIHTGAGIEAKSHGSNHPPVMNSPIGNASRVLLLPRGPAAVLEFSDEPGTDSDGDDLTYRFGFVVPGISGATSPEDALLNISREGNRFDILSEGVLTPAEFTSVYGNRATVPTVLSAIFASDGSAESQPKTFNLRVVYDGSAQFSAPAQYVGDQRWQIPDFVEVYEGTSLLENGQLPGWTSVISARRNWGMDWSYPLVRCEISSSFFPYTYPNGGVDNDRFLLDSETQSTSGTVPLSFKSLPDFENPGDMNGDNKYQIRVVNTNNIHRLGGEGSPTGCSGSVLDFTIRVRDVGVPAPPMSVRATFMDFDDTMLKVNWTDPGGFLENGSLVPFPAGFEVSSYDYRYRAYGSDVWTEVTDTFLTETAVTLDGMTEDAYEVQVRGSNSEGTGSWSSVVRTVKIVHAVCFDAPQYSAIEGDPAGVEIEVHLTPPAGDVPVTVHLAVEEQDGADHIDYKGVPSSITFAPQESVQSFRVMVIDDGDEDEAAVEYIRLMFVDLPNNVTTEAPAFAVLALEDPPAPSVEDVRITSTPRRGNYYGFGEIIEVELTFDAPVEVTGRPNLWLQITCPGWRSALYSRGSGTNKLYFQYCVVRSDYDSSGIAVSGGNITLANGDITAVSSGVTVNLFFEGLPADPNHKVNGCLY